MLYLVFTFLLCSVLPEASCAKKLAHCDNSCLTLLAVRLPGNSALHDFGGNGGGTAYYKGRSTVVESADMNGTWYEIGLGANLGIAKNSNLYFDALKTFGGDLRTDWQFNAGLRFTF